VAIAEAILCVVAMAYRWLDQSFPRRVVLERLAPRQDYYLAELGQYIGTSFLFMMNHLFGIGVTSIGGRHPVLFVNTFVFGVVFGVIYKETNSLRWLIIAHALTDLFGLSVAVFLNLWVPPA
jgi:membrane protease YdiL (CAAX protease family)